ncbi:hypothetical protein P7C70_g7842, partial [Phenoliferia sp. Uapishka_3]
PNTDPSSSLSTRTTSLAISPAGDPPTSLLMLSSWLGLAASSQLLSSSLTSPTSPSPATSTATNSAVRPEMVANVCALLITILRGAEVAGVEKGRMDELRSVVLGPLKGAWEKSEGPLRVVAGRAVEVCEGT